MAFATGHDKLGGRRRGTPNRLHAELREMIREALMNAGGVSYLEQQARENPTAFLSLIARLIPSGVRAEVSAEQPVKIEVITGFSTGPHQR